MKNDGKPVSGDFPGSAILKTVAYLLVIAMLNACASAIPENIRRPMPGDVGIVKVSQDVDAHRGLAVRWGGVVLQLENREADTLIEILGYKLNGSGRPETDTASQGRFMAKLPGFADPEVYKEGREVTVVGKVQSSLTRAIGDYSYVYPVVSVETLQLWDKRLEEPRRYYYDPYWDYHPWYWHPYYPWYPRPYPYW